MIVSCENFMNKMRLSSRARDFTFAVLQPLEQRIEFLQLRFYDHRLLDRACNRLKSFVSVTGNRHDHDLILLDAALLDEFFSNGKRGATRWFGKDALGAREEFDRVDDLGIARDLAPSAGFAHRL